MEEESCLSVRSALKYDCHRSALKMDVGLGGGISVGSRLLLPSICQSKAALNLSTKLRDPHTALDFRLERAVDGSHEDLR